VQAAAARDVEQAKEEVDALVSTEGRDFRAAGADEKTDTEIINANLFYQRVVRLQLDNAVLGCHQAEVALFGWFDYWRILQNMGIAEDPDVFPIVDGVARSNSFDFPERIIDSGVGQCAQEAHDRCVATGDFSSIFIPLAALQRTWEVMLGREMKQGCVDAFVRAAKLCGQWTLAINTDFETKGIPGSCCGIFGKIHRDITLHWEPNGTGLGNIYYSTIVGEGDLTVDSLDFSGICSHTHTPPAQTEKAKAKIAGLVFEKSDKGLVTPRHVWLEIQFGQVETKLSARCPKPEKSLEFDNWGWLADEFEVSPLLLANRDVVTAQEPDIQGFLIADNPSFSSSLEVPSLWKFSLTPFRADLDISRSDSTHIASHYVRMTLRLTHTPH
jgi:hypothetical protein